MTPGRWRLIAAALVLLGCVRIALTWRVFSQTVDEPFHIAAGMEWLSEGRYELELQHPPLSRIAAAFGPWLAGGRSHGIQDGYQEGSAILAAGPGYWTNLVLARAPNLIFFILSCWAVWLWSEQLFGAARAAGCVALFSGLPVVLGHAGLATTDMAVAAGVGLALAFFDRWIERRTWRSALLFGVMLALSLSAKFSAIPFLICGCSAILAVRRRLVSWRQALAACGVAFFLVWSTYRFQLSPMAPPNPPPVAELDALFGGSGPLRAGVNAAMAVPVPLGSWIRGIYHVYFHNSRGHATMLFDSFSFRGWWYYFPVVMAFKTPLGFLGLALAALVFLRTKDRARSAPGLAAAAIFFSCLPSHIDIGLRHLLPMFVPLSVACGAVLWPERRVAKLAVLALAAGAAISSALAHPDYLTYFNELALDQPERIVADSDLDWGQDLEKVRARLAELGIRECAVTFHGSTDLDSLGMPCRILKPYEKAQGWVVMSINKLRMGEFEEHADSKQWGAYSWIRAYRPVERIGKSMWLYRVD
ncbi:MAG: glycosyltransferase family 39 protein [Bryobacteraceae bacterium]